MRRQSTPGNVDTYSPRYFILSTRSVIEIEWFEKDKNDVRYFTFITYSWCQKTSRFYTIFSGTVQCKNMVNADIVNTL